MDEKSFAVLALGLVLMLTGAGMAFYNPIEVAEVGQWESTGSHGIGWYWKVDIPEQTIYPNLGLGTIVCLIGLVAAVIAFALPKQIKPKT